LFRALIKENDDDNRKTCRIEYTRFATGNRDTFTRKRVSPDRTNEHGSVRSKTETSDRCLLDGGREVGNRKWRLGRGARVRNLIMNDRCRRRRSLSFRTTAAIVITVGEESGTTYKHNGRNIRIRTKVSGVAEITTPTLRTAGG